MRRNSAIRPWILETVAAGFAMLLMAACGGGGGGGSSTPPPPAPVISSFTPTSGVAGHTVTLSGSAFTGATGVSFHGASAPVFSVSNATTIIVAVPQGASTGPISVTGPGGTAASSASFTVLAGTGITGFSPASGAAGTVVTIDGTSFTGATAVQFNGTPAAAFSVASDTSITATVPAHGTAGPITVTSPAGTATSTRFVAGSLALFAGVVSGTGNVDSPAPASAARFFGPYSAAVDAAGILYLADRLNNTIRKITPAGAVSTLAGKADVAGSADTAAGVTALFNDPTGVAVGPVTGNLYVADRGNSNIRMITPAGTVTTFSGTGTSGNDNGPSTGTPRPSFNHPTGLAVDAAENLYVADSGNNSIRKIVPAAPGTLPVTVSTLASGFSGPAAVAVDSAGIVYLADTGNGAIMKIAAGTTTTVAAGFTNPLGIAVDAATPVNVYVTDATRNLISVVDSSSGTVTTFSGWGDHSGSREGFGFQPSTSTVPGNAPSFDFPTGIALGTLGNPTAGSLFVTDFNNDTVRRIPVTPGTPPASTTTTSTYAGKAGTPGLSNGTLIGSALFNFPAGVAADAAGTLYVADANNHVVRALFPPPSPTGATTLQPTGPAFVTPIGVAVDSHTGSGNIYVADSGNNAIQVISGTTVTTLSPGTTFSSPFGVALDASGNLYVADTFNNLVKKITIAAPATLPVTGTSTTLPGTYNHPFAVAVDTASGNIYIADTLNHAIKMVSGGVASTLAGSPAAQAGFADGTGALALFNHPNGIAVDPATGNVYVADTFNQAIRMITTSGPATGKVVTLAGTGTLGTIAPGDLPAQLAFPYGIALDPLLTTDALGNANPDGSLVISVNDAILTMPF